MYNQSHQDKDAELLNEFRSMIQKIVRLSGEATIAAQNQNVMSYMSIMTELNSISDNIEQLFRHHSGC